MKKRAKGDTEHGPKITTLDLKLPNMEKMLIQPNIDIGGSKINQKCPTVGL